MTIAGKIGKHRPIGARAVALLALILAFAAPQASFAKVEVPPDSRLANIAKTKTLKLGYRPDARPFSFVNPAQMPTGFTVDLCLLVAKSIETQLGLDVLRIEWVSVNSQSRFSAVASGRADMECGASTVTLSRMNEVDFSNYVFLETTGLLVAKNSNIRAFSDLAGKRIAVIAGTTNERAILDQIKLRKIETTVFSVKDNTEAIAMLESGGADGFASDKLLLIGAPVKDRNALVMLPDDLSIEPYAIVLPRGDWALRLMVNTALSEIYRDGRVATVFKNWFERVGLQMTPALRVLYGLGALSN